jgi:hypothetical protein
MRNHTRFVLEKTWDEKTRPPETYKLQSNDSRNKIKAEVHQDSGKLGVKFTIDKTIPEFEKGAKKVVRKFPGTATFLRKSHNFFQKK